MEVVRETEPKLRKTSKVPRTLHSKEGKVPTKTMEGAVKANQPLRS